MAKNPWLVFLAKYRKSNPGKSMKDCMKEAGKLWKKKKSSK